MILTLDLTEAELAALLRVAHGLGVGTARDQADCRTRDTVVLRLIALADLQQNVDVRALAIPSLTN
jgi:hypothetical protein